MNLLSFDLNLLKVLDALLRDPSVTRAAERVGLSQPAASAALKRLRAAFGDPLFVRNGQRLVPTPFALTLAGPLDSALAALGTVIASEPDFDPATATGRFRIYGSDDWVHVLMPELARRLARDAPGIAVHFLDLQPAYLREPMFPLECDIGIYPRWMRPDWSEAQPLMQSSMTVTARQGHPELEAAGVAPGDLVPLDLFCRLGHVVFSPRAHDGTQVDAALAALGRKRRIAMTMPYFSAVARIAADSDLLATLPTGLAARIGAKEGLCRYRLPLALPPIQIEMFWHPRHTEAPAHRWLRATLREIAAPIDQTAALHGSDPTAIPGAM